MTTTTNDTVHIWTDGACIGNPGPGGWAYLKTFGGRRAYDSGNVCGTTTNNAMELIATIQAIRSLKRSDLPAILYSDSRYVVDGINRYIANWIANGWRTSDKKPVANRAQWEALQALVDARSAGAEITFAWVRGHAGQPQNEEVDRLAEGAARQAAHVSGGAPAMPTRFDHASGLVVPLFDIELA